MLGLEGIVSNTLTRFDMVLNLDPDALVLALVLMRMRVFSVNIYVACSPRGLLWIENR